MIHGADILSALFVIMEELWSIVILISANARL